MSEYSVSIEVSGVANHVPRLWAENRLADPFLRLPARVNDSPSYILRLSLLVVVGAMAYSCLDSKSPDRNWKGEGRNTPRAVLACPGERTGFP